MRFLVGYDGSNCARDALDVASKHAKAFNAEVLVVQSMEGGRSTEAGKVQKANQDLAFAETFMKERGVSIQTHLLVRGMAPGEDIIQYAKEKDVDSIFIGIRRRSKVGKLIFGSNAQYIILQSDCPVVTVK